MSVPAGPKPISFSLSTCFLGMVLAAKTKDGLCAVLFGDTEAALHGDLHQRFPTQVPVRDDYALRETLDVLVPWMEATHLPCALPLAPQGTTFQQCVWRALLKVQAGHPTTYTALAQTLGLQGSTRAVAGAVAANPLAVLVPCHRVVRADGQLAGYRWGLERKRTLLAREAAACPFSLRA